MKSLRLLLFIALLLATTFAFAQSDPQASEKAALDKLAKALPSLYWYASDACLRETSRHGPQTLKYKNFVTSNHVEVQQSEATVVDGRRGLSCRMKLVDPAEPEEYWVFEFTNIDGKWSARTAYKYLGQKRTFDLYEADPFMGSMKPYIQRGLDAISRGKDYTTLYYPLPKENPGAATSATQAPVQTPTSFPFTAEKAAAVRGPSTSPRPQIGDTVEQYRHFIGESFVPGPMADLRGTKWKLKSITKNYVEIELVEGRYMWDGKPYKGVGDHTQWMSTIHYCDAFKRPNMDMNSEFWDEWRKVSP